MGSCTVFPAEPLFLCKQKNGVRILLLTFQVQDLIWTGDSGSNPEWAHGYKFLCP